MLSMSYKIRYDMTKRNEAIAILTGGGPAPGMNTVVGSVAKTFLQKGYSVIGLHKGFTGLFREAPATENITFLKADEIFNLAGSFLRMSRFKPSDEDFEKRFNWQFFTENNIKLLVTIGGDDTASTPTAWPNFWKKSVIRSLTYTSRKPSTTTFRCPTVHRPSATNRPKTRER